MHDLDNPYPYFESLRRQGAVTRLADSSFYLVGSWDLVAEAVGRPEDFSSNLTATMVWNEDGTVSEYPIAEMGSPLHVLATADEPLHRVHRTMVMPSMVAKRVRGLEPFIAQELRRLWDDGLDGSDIDWVHAIAQRLPMAVVAELVGFPTYDIDDLVRWAFSSTVLLDGVVTASQLVDATQAVGELSAYLAEAFERSLVAPGENVMGDLARLVSADRLDHDSAVMILIQLVAAGSESTVSLLGSAVWMLGLHPEIEGELRSHRDYVPLFIEEALRLESPFRGHYRHVVADTTLGDIDLPAGSHLYLLWGSANRDPAAVDDPGQVCLDSGKRRPHMAFGKGLHMCVGAPLARLEAKLAIEFLLDSTTAFDVETTDPQWERSLMVRRLRTLPVTVQS